ncbi:hydroxyproline-rich glycoprotein family protein [Euphorbia peplus]|nr:hydroxyproline-rich glycoprotein family protein [Euphorbia peplus]
MEEEEDIPPFWLQSPGGSRRLRRKASSIFFNSGVLLLLLLVIAFIFIFVIIPTFVNFTSQIFKPNSIKKSWDSLNLVLVLFAIVCGFLGRNHNNNSNNNNESPSYQRMDSANVDRSYEAQSQRSYPTTPVNRWYQDRTAYSGLNRLRSFNSYPDLRQESLWMNSDDRWRFYDDTHLNGYRISHSDQVAPEKKQQELKNIKREDEDVKSKDVEVEIDTSVKEVVYTPPPPESPLPPPLSPPRSVPRSTAEIHTRPVKRKVKRTYEDIGYEKRKVEQEPAPEKDLELKNFNVPPQPPSHTAAPPVVNRNEKKRGKDLLMTPFRKKKKKLKQRQQSVENLESLFDPQSSFYQSSIPPPSPAPPPPPPPPPPHFFQNLFSTKKSRSKKAHSAPTPPPPPPPPRVRASRTTVTVAAGTMHEPPAVTEENVNNSGNMSPYNPIPAPPPLPPFKMNSWKFIRDGDYVRVASFESSRSGSPDLESEETSPVAEPAVMPLFCPSPDVNTKAENFIARFRAGLKMEKVNSGKGRSNLGPGPGSATVEGEGPT